MASEKRRLIDANALREQMFSYYGCVNENTSKEYYRGETIMNYEVADLIEDCIDNAPTVDAVEVVRCKDCKHYMEYPLNKVDKRMCCYVHLLTPHFTPEDGFCSYGERREGE